MVEERPFLCEEEYLNKSDDDINERIFSVKERENKNTQFLKLQRILNHIDINMTLVKYLIY